MALFRCSSGSSGGVHYAEGTVSVSTSSRTSIQTVDVNTGIPFKPKTIIYNTKTPGISYYLSVIYDEDATEFPDTTNKQVCILNNNTTTHQIKDIPYTGGDRVYIYSIDADGFTVDKTTSGYGNTCNYKAWG